MDYDFITTCNWTATGTYTLQAFRGDYTNVASSYTIYYRKKGASTWSSTTNGKISITSTGEWEVANNWNKSGNDCLTHSYRGITAIDKCTDVYFNETTLGTTVGDYFLFSCWYGCTSLTSMPSGFNLPSGITSVGDYFLRECWKGCTSLTSMPSGFNLPTTVTGASWYCFRTWYDCTALKADDYTEDIDFTFSAPDAFGGTCPITPDSPTAGSTVAVNRTYEPAVTTQDCTNIIRTSVLGNGEIISTGKSGVTERGFCYKAGTTGDPTTSDSTVKDTGTYSTGTYTKSITGLTAGTTYRVRAYAINADGTGYGKTITITTYIGLSGTVTLSGTGVEGAIVRIIQQDTDEEVDKQTTDSNGDYESVQLIKDKKYHVCVEYTDGSSNKYNSKSLWDVIPG